MDVRSALANWFNWNSWLEVLRHHPLEFAIPIGCVIGVLVLYVTRYNPEKDYGYWAISKDLGYDPEAMDVRRHSDTLNAKVSSLLTHVSIMIAISSAFFVHFVSQSGSSASDYDLMAEILVYMLSTLLCLSAIPITKSASFKNDGGKHLERFQRLVTQRKSRYRLALALTIGDTVIFMGSIYLRMIGVTV